MKQLKFYVMAVVAAVLFSACGTTRTVPLTGRKQNLMISDQEVLSLSTQEYTKYMQSAKKSTNATNTAMVQRVGKNLAGAVQTYVRMATRASCKTMRGSSIWCKTRASTLFACLAERLSSTKDCCP